MSKVYDVIVCKFCNKKYKKQGYYNKHKIICEIINSDNTDTNLGIHNLSQVVIELVKANHKLEKDVLDLKRYINSKKQKIVIIDWLNTTSVPLTNYKRFLEEISISRKDLEFIFNNNYIVGVSQVLHSLIKNNNYISIFKAFEQKDNTIYIFKEKWEILSSIDFEELFSIISKYIIIEFKKWQDENASILFTDKFSVKYITNVKKILGNDSLNKQRAIIHRNLYKFLQENLQCIVEYKFS